jgi:outer membrane protein assembly factor BamB
VTVRVMIRKLVTAIAVCALTVGSGAAQAFAQTSGGPVQVKVKPGDTLWQIALRNKVSLADTIRTNNMLDPDRVLAGASLFLPYPVSPKTEPYTAQRGDTPAAIAARFTTSLNNIYTLNQMLKPTAPILAGQTLQVSRGPEAVCPAGQGCLRTYAVMPGDTLGSIAWTAHVNIADLARVNNLKDLERLSVGQTLIIPTAAPVQAPLTWTNEQGDPGRSGYNPTATLGSQAKLLWSTPALAGRYQYGSGMVLGDGMLFAGGIDKEFRAMNPDTGAVTWTTQLDGEYGVGTPAYDPVHKLVIVTTDGMPDGHVYALDAHTGKIKWQGLTSGEWSAQEASPVVDGNRVFVVGKGGGAALYAFDAETGRRLWVGNGDFGQVPVVSGGKVFASYLSGQVYAFKEADGTRLWTTAGGWSGGGRYTTMAVDGRVFAISNEYDTYVVAKDAETGKELWRYTDNRIAQGASLASDGPLVWVPLDGGVLALDSATGAVKREVKLGEPRHGDTRTTGPVIGKTHLFVPEAGKIWAVDRQTGAATELATGKGPLALVADGSTSWHWTIPTACRCTWRLWKA